MSIYADSKDGTYTMDSFRFSIRCQCFLPGKADRSPGKTGTWHLWSEELDRTFSRIVGDRFTCRASLKIRTCEYRDGERAFPQLILEIMEPSMESGIACLSPKDISQPALYYDRDDYQYLVRLARRLEPLNRYLEWEEYKRHVIRRAVERTAFGDYLYENSDDSRLWAVVDRLALESENFGMEGHAGDTAYQRELIRHYLYRRALSLLAGTDAAELPW